MGRIKCRLRWRSFSLWRRPAGWRRLAAARSCCLRSRNISSTCCARLATLRYLNCARKGGEYAVLHRSTYISPPLQSNVFLLVLFPVVSAPLYLSIIVYSTLAISRRRYYKTENPSSTFLFFFAPLLILLARSSSFFCRHRLKSSRHAHSSSKLSFLPFLLIVCVCVFLRAPTVTMKGNITVIQSKSVHSC